MNDNGFGRVAGVVFACVALAHGYRAALALPLTVGTTAIPVWASWLGVVIAGTLAVWGFRAPR